MKYGYTCTCGWRLDRGNLTRREYAGAKEVHAVKCEALQKELEASRKVPAK